jgi:hypothetical protein
MTSLPVPKFARGYAALGAMIEVAIDGHAADVRSRVPAPELVLGMNAKSWGATDLAPNSVNALIKFLVCNALKYIYCFLR